jgi:DNA primase
MNKLDLLEANILRALLRHGEDLVFKKETVDKGLPPLTAAEFIYNSLQVEQIDLANPLYRQIYQEYETHYHQEGFQAIKYFSAHQIPAISLLTVELLNNPYELSKMHEKMPVSRDENQKLDDLISRVVLELKNYHLTQLINEVKEKLKIASDQHDDQASIQLTAALLELFDVQKDLAKQLGERIIVDF